MLSTNCSIIALRHPEFAGLRTKTVKSYHETMSLRTISRCETLGYVGIIFVGETTVLSTETNKCYFPDVHPRNGRSSGCLLINPWKIDTFVTVKKI